MKIGQYHDLWHASGWNASGLWHASGSDASGWGSRYDAWSGWSVGREWRCLGNREHATFDLANANQDNPDGTAPVEEIEVKE